jgi:alpha-L-fucosidase
MKHAQIALFLALTLSTFTRFNAAAETPAAHNQRMEWFRDARFGMFLHWGVYAVPAGAWNGKTNYGEWFLENTQMPVSQYEKFAAQFNPTNFNAREWVRMAKDAGMRYIVITSKHHDGFGIYRSGQTDWCVKTTPFQRDPLKELADACRAADIRLCLYYSIMDWHHPDWGKRRAWNDKATGTPDMDRYVAYMKRELKELLTRYGPIGILWFDGEWEDPWTHERGVDLYNYVRSLQPDIIINNRVGKGRAGMSGMDKGARRVGDYGTPEQGIPATGFGPGVDWESCMTMNDHWGYNKHDDHWKSSTTLIRNLIDCSSKGGNYLLNIGPTAQGVFPPPAVARLADIGRWMKINGDAIYGTQASPFENLPWGRCTRKPSPQPAALAGFQQHAAWPFQDQRRTANAVGTRLYFFVYDWPKDGQLVVPGLASVPTRAFLLNGHQPLKFAARNGSVAIQVPPAPPNESASVVVLDIEGAPVIAKP